MNECSVSFLTQGLCDEIIIPLQIDQMFVFCRRPLLSTCLLDFVGAFSFHM